MKALHHIIRQQVLRQNTASIRALFLNGAQMDMLRRIGSRDVTSRVIASELSISMQNAYAKLEQLRRGGYLTRENIGKPNGGSMYRYGVTRVVSNLVNS
jgi:predicted transcriptional regulator